MPGGLSNDEFEALDWLRLTLNTGGLIGLTQYIKALGKLKVRGYVESIQQEPLRGRTLGDASIHYPDKWRITKVGLQAHAAAKAQRK